MKVLYGEYEALMIRVFWEGGPRLSELLRIKFEDIKIGGYTGYHIELFHPNQNKNDRPRRFAISEDTYTRLMELWLKMAEIDDIRDGQNIWGRLSEGMVRYRVKKACTKKLFADGKQLSCGSIFGCSDFRNTHEL
jgi:integrase